MEAVLLFDGPILSILRQPSIVCINPCTYTLSQSSWNGFMLFGDSHAFWAVVDDLVVTPLVDSHLAPFARKSLDKESARKSKEKTN